MHLSDAQRIILRELRDGPRDKHELAMQCGIQPTTVKDHLQKLREQGNEIQYSKKLQKYHIDNHPTISAGKLDYEEVATKIKNGAKLINLADEFVTTKDELQTVLSDLENQGYTIETKTVDGDTFAYMPEGLDRRYKLSSVDDEFIFGLISDTHLGSSAEHLEELHDYYDRIESRGIEHVFHCGDISDGWKVHTGHLNEVKNSAAGWGNLREYVTDNYPNRKNTTTHFVEGNHDNKFYNRNNIRFGKLLGQDRDDLHYCGNSQATFVFDERHDINLELIHPSGGKPYTKGYRMQTLYRERSVSDRPSIAGIGHLHGSMFAETEGVKGLYAGCWKGTTTYGKRKGHEANIGGWIIRMQISNGTIRKLVPEWVGFEEKETANRHALQDLG